MKRTGKTYSTPKSIRLTMANLLEEYRKGDSDYELGEIKGMVYILSQIQSVLRFEKDMDIEDRLDAIEARLDGR